MVEEILFFLSCVTFCGPPIVECGRKAVRVKAPVHPHLMSTREPAAATGFSIEFRSDFCLISARFLEGAATKFYIELHIEISILYHQ